MPASRKRHASNSRSVRVPTWLKITAALWAAVFLFIVITLPPARRDARAFGAGHVWRGAFHVHTVNSDGGGTREDVARAAASAGLQFVILTDHGDGTRAPAPPEYINQVLILDGVEVTTSGGHYAAFGAGQSPYPLGGPAYAVIEDIARLGGFGVAAHPDSTKVDLRWRDWNAPVDGFEVVNGDSAWRDEGTATLARALIGYPFRAPAVLAGLVERPTRLLQRLDDMNRARRVVALSGADAHARLPLTSDDEPYENAWTVPAPSYAQSFKTFANLVDTGRPRTGDAAHDASVLTDAIRAGRVTFAMTALAEPPELSFVAIATSGDAAVRHHPGSRVPASGVITFEARVSDVEKSGESQVRLTLLRGGAIAAQSRGPKLTFNPMSAPGVWRVEVSLAHRPLVPWLISNPIVIVEPPDAATPASAQPAATKPAMLDLSAGIWAIEKHAGSSGGVAVEGAGQRFSYALAGGESSGQYAAAVRATDNAEAWDTVVVTARAAAPARVWVQLRLTDSGSGQRWGRSIYLDATPRTYRLPIRDFAPLEPRPTGLRPNVVQVRAVLLVADTVNTRPGGQGAVIVERIGLERTPGR